MVNVLLLTVLSLLIRFCAAIPQGISISAIPESQSAAPTTCGGCFIGADVIAVIVGDVVEVTATEVTTVSTARNGTQVTVTSTVTVIPETVPFTFTSGGVEPPAPTGTVVAQTGSVVTYLGLTLSAPFSYNIITAYSLTSTTVNSDGSCVIVRGPPTPVPSPSPYTLLPGQPLIALAAEEAFASAYAPTCSPVGINPASTFIPIPITTTLPITSTVSTISTIVTAFPISVTPSTTSTSTSTSAPSSTPSTSTTPSTTSTESTAVTATVSTLTLSITSTLPLTTITSTSIETTTSSVSTLSSISTSSSSASVTTLATPLPSPSTVSSSSPSSIAPISSPSSSAQVTSSSLTPASTVTTTVSIGTIIIVGNTTIPIASSGTGYYSPTATPFPGAASALNAGFMDSWLFWASGFVSTLLALCIL